MGGVVYITGPKGCGKSRLAEDVSTLLPFYCSARLKIVDTYTDRQPRQEKERGHVFISHEDFSRKVADGEISAFGTPFNSNYRIGLNTAILEKMIEKDEVPLVVTRVPEIVKAVSSYNDSFGILLDVAPYSAETPTPIMFNEEAGVLRALPHTAVIERETKNKSEILIKVMKILYEHFLQKPKPSSKQATQIVG